jgi:hypothetical protein
VIPTEFTPPGSLGKWLRGLMYPGLAGMMLAMVAGFVELLKINPAAGTEMLKSWGPGFVLAILALVVVGSFLDKMVDAQTTAVDAQQKVALALSALAERDDRDRDRMVTETQYMAQRMDQTHIMVASVSAQLTRIELRLGLKETGD